MALKQPESMDDLVYFTRRILGEGKAKVWVFCKDCDKCGSLMKKPRDPKTGRPKIRADTYVCIKCGNEETKAEVEPSLMASINYTCPECKTEGEGSIPYVRKSYKGTKALMFECSKCSAKIPVTKKMKELKK